MYENTFICMQVCKNSDKKYYYKENIKESSSVALLSPTCQWYFESKLNPKIEPTAEIKNTVGAKKLGPKIFEQKKLS